MRQLSRQNISRQTRGRQFFGKDISSLSKKVTVQIQTKDLGRPTCFLSSPTGKVSDTHKNLNSL